MNGATPGRVRSSILLAVLLLAAVATFGCQGAPGRAGAPSISPGVASLIPPETWQAVGSCATFLGAVAALWAACEAKKAAEETRKAAIAEVFLQVRQQYASEDMDRDMQLLRDWKREQGARFAAVFAEASRAEDRVMLGRFNALNAARRRYSHLLVQQVGRLWSAKLLDERYVRELVGRDEVEFLAKVLKPLEKALAEAEGKEAGLAIFDRFETLYGVQAEV